MRLPFFLVSLYSALGSLNAHFYISPSPISQYHHHHRHFALLRLLSRHRREQSVSTTPTTTSSWMLMIARNNILICFNISSNDYFYVDFYHRALVTLSRFYWLLIPTLGREEKRKKIRRMEKVLLKKYHDVWLDVSLSKRLYFFSLNFFHFEIDQAWLNQ